MIYIVANFEPKEDITTYELAEVIKMFKLSESTICERWYPSIPKTSVVLHKKNGYDRAKFELSDMSRHFKILEVHNSETKE